MFFKRRIILVYAVLITPFSYADATLIKPVTSVAQVKIFTALPATCITLRQGRTCFANITISLDLIAEGDYCVYQQGETHPIHCWHKTAPKVLNLAFESAQKIVYSLKNEQSQQIIALTAVEVSWVRKASSRKRRWRLF